jgi:hypothetical protein
MPGVERAVFVTEGAPDLPNRHTDPSELADETTSESKQLV